MTDPLLIANAIFVLAAAVVFTLGVLLPSWNELPSVGVPPEAIAAITAVGAPIIGVVAALPTALVVVIAEAFGWRSVLFYALVGGALGLVLSFGLDGPPDVNQSGPLLLRERQLHVAAGIESASWPHPMACSDCGKARPTESRPSARSGRPPTWASPFRAASRWPVSATFPSPTTCVPA